MGAHLVEEAAQGVRPDARCVLASDPVETFRAHIWVAPFYEDDLGGLKDVSVSTTCSSDRTGRTPRDWPNRGPSPADLRRFGYTEDEIHTVMAENGWVLTRRI